MSFSTLTWGVKASFRSYVEAAGGSVKLSDGATRADDGSFVFTAVPGGNFAIESDGSASGEMRFQGTITFDGEILGLIYSVAGLQGSGTLRNPAVAYKRGGVEGNDFLEMSHQAGAHSVSWDMSFGAGLDQMRIIVACP